MNALKLHKWTCKVRGGHIYSVEARDLPDAVRQFTNLYRIDMRKLDYLNEEGGTNSKPEYIVTVGSRDYTVPANDELEVYRVLVEHGLDASKARNFRRKE